jgi:ribosomal protein L11 methyltransferase
VLRDWPALDIPDADDLLLAALDDFAPTAIEERDCGVRVFFASFVQRDAALASLTGRPMRTVAVDISDDDWAVRSQQDLTPIVVGRIRIVPHPRFLLGADPVTPILGPAAIDVVIEPSMGFGTGHHATTRLCLAALQGMDLGGTCVLDIGTGSGILAIAGARLGAARVHGIDCDADALQCAHENLARNPDARHVTFEAADLATGALPDADLVMANLTGAMLARSAHLLLAATRTNGTLLLSGILAAESDDVQGAFATAELRQRTQEDEWVCLLMKKQ